MTAFAYKAFNSEGRLELGEIEAGHADDVVRILDQRWCVRRDGRLVPADADEFDAFVMPDKTVTDGIGEWKRLSRYLADRGLVVPGDRDAIAAALNAGHWRPYRCVVERYRGRRCDTGVSATLARGSSGDTQRRAA